MKRLLVIIILTIITISSVSSQVLVEVDPLEDGVVIWADKMVQAYSLNLSCHTSHGEDLYIVTLKLENLRLAKTIASQIETTQLLFIEYNGERYPLEKADVPADAPWKGLQTYVGKSVIAEDFRLNVYVTATALPTMKSLCNAIADTRESDGINEGAWDLQKELRTKEREDDLDPNPDFARSARISEIKEKLASINEIWIRTE